VNSGGGKKDGGRKRRVFPSNWGAERMPFFSRTGRGGEVDLKGKGTDRKGDWEKILIGGSGKFK